MGAGSRPGVARCNTINHFSNPRTIFQGEQLGVDWKYDNAKLLNQNRFILEQSDNENMTCSWGFGYKQNLVDCLLTPIIAPAVAINCDGFDEDYPLFEAPLFYHNNY